MEEQKSPLELDSILNIGSLEKNSLILFRVDEVSPAIYGAIDRLEQLYGEIFKEKNISFLILRPDTKIETLNEKQMQSMGWQKKDKSLIIH